MVQNTSKEELKNIFTIFVFSSLLLGFLTCCDKAPENISLIKDKQTALGDILNKRGINLGNALEAPMPGEWGVKIQPEYFDIIRSACFDAVRLPVRFSAHTSQIAPYLIDPAFLALVDLVINRGLNAGLSIILDLHHFDEIMVDPAGQHDRYLAIWRQLSHHYQNYPSNLSFELLNEPNQQLDAKNWNLLITESISLIRRTNPRRLILIGGTDFNSIDSLNLLQLPPDDNLAAVFHFYEPFEFTHQGASWIAGSQQWLGKTWRGTKEEKKYLSDQLDHAAAWSLKNQVPVIMNEFGAMAEIDADSRRQWTAFTARAAEERNIGWVYWEFCSQFKVYDCKNNSWDSDLLMALIPE